MDPPGSWLQPTQHRGGGRLPTRTNQKDKIWPTLRVQRRKPTDKINQNKRHGIGSGVNESQFSPGFPWVDFQLPGRELKFKKIRRFSGEKLKKLRRGCTPEGRRTERFRGRGGGGSGRCTRTPSRGGGPFKAQCTRCS